jgi:hypothetical protein
LSSFINSSGWMDGWMDGWGVWTGKYFFIGSSSIVNHSRVSLISIFFIA